MFNNNRNNYTINNKHSNVETIYTVEWTKNQTLIDQLDAGSYDLDFSRFNHNKFNNLNQAMQYYINLEKANTPYVRLFLEVSINGEIVIEDCITDIEYNSKEHELINKIADTQDQTLFSIQSFLHRNKWDMVWDTFQKETHAEYHNPEYYQI